MIGETNAPTPKKKCSAFMYGPTRAPCTHTSNTLPPTSSVPWATPVIRHTNARSHSSGITGIRAMVTPMATTMAAITGWPGIRSYSHPPRTEPSRYPSERAMNTMLISLKTVFVRAARPAIVGPSEAVTSPSAMKETK